MSEGEPPVSGSRVAPSSLGSRARWAGYEYAARHESWFEAWQSHAVAEEERRFILLCQGLALTLLLPLLATCLTLSKSLI